MSSEFEALEMLHMMSLVFLHVTNINRSASSGQVALYVIFTCTPQAKFGSCKLENKTLKH